MPGRKIPLITGETYHIFNRGTNRQPTFIDKRELDRAKFTINFYIFLKPSISLSKFLRLESKKQNEFMNLLKQNKKTVEILSYCLMPNHFHFLLKQQEDNGIAKFISNFQNSYTKYFNIKRKRDGSLFLDQFKAVRVETDEQLLHLSRYIHLNPYTSYVVKTFAELEKYPWSSLPDYLKKESNNININFIIDFFGGIKKYKKFIFDQADYQRKLKEIKHLLLETH